MVTGNKMLPVPEVELQLPETTKVAAVSTETCTISGPLDSAGAKLGCRRAELAQMMVRLLCVATSLTAVMMMVTAREAGTVSFYGFQLPIYSNWSFSYSFEYLVGVSAGVTAHSLLQLLISASKLLTKSPVITSRNHAWLVFAADQAFTYALLSAGSAASGVSNLNRTGIRHTTLPNFCKPLHNFCDHVAVSIAFTFFSCFLVAVSAVQDVIWLSNN